MDFACIRQLLHLTGSYLYSIPESNLFEFEKVDFVATQTVRAAPTSPELLLRRDFALKMSGAEDLLFKIRTPAEKQVVVSDILSRRLTPQTNLNSPYEELFRMGFLMQPHIEVLYEAVLLPVSCNSSRTFGYRTFVPDFWVHNYQLHGKDIFVEPHGQSKMDYPYVDKLLAVSQTYNVHIVLATTSDMGNRDNLAEHAKRGLEFWYVDDLRESQNHILDKISDLAGRAQKKPSCTVENLVDKLTLRL